MRTAIFTLLILAGISQVKAEGYQVNLQSTKQAGMGHVGASMKLGAESMHFNPAGMAFMQDRVDLSGGVSAIFSKATYEYNGVKSKTDNSPGTPVYVYAGFKINKYLAAGLSVTNPYGSTLNWGKNWVGAHLIQDISLKAFVLQPTLSYRITDRISVGAGLMVAFGSVELSRALLPAGTLGGNLKDVIPVSATLNGKSDIRLGYNVGVMVDVTSKLTLGASFRSKVDLKVKEGTASLDYASEAIKQAIGSLVPPLDKGTFKAEMPLPANLNIGASYRINDRLLLAAEIQTVFWKAYDELNIRFTEEVLGGYNIKATKNYHNTVIARIGGQYELTSRSDIRGGIYYDQSPIDKELYNPETPGMDKIGISVGYSFRPIKNLSVDLAFLYIQGLGADGSYPDPTQANQQFSGHYTTIGIVPSVGLSFRF